jgi:acyl carrier protein
MSTDKAAIIQRLRARLNEVAASLGNDASRLSDTDIIPDAEVVDSAGLLEFVVWYDEAFSLDLQPEEMTVDNLGSLASMADFALARGAR